MSHRHNCLNHMVAVVVAVPLALSMVKSGVANDQRPFDQIINQLESINDQLDSQLADSYVPFSVEVVGGLCNSAIAPSANPEVLINTDGTSPFVVHGILIKRGFLDPVDFMFLSVNAVVIDGMSFDTRTHNIFLDSSQTQTAVFHSADIMGMPVRLSTQVAAPHEPGGNVPHQIVANVDEALDDIKVELFCRSDTQDFEIQVIRVSGWKQPDDTISVDYVPGS